MKIAVILLAAALCLPLTPATCSARDSVSWLRVRSAPFYIYEDDVCVGGMAYDIERLLREHLPEYDHKSGFMNLKRAAKLMREGRNWCAPFFIRTPEREEFMAFSIPSMVLFPNSVIARTDDPRFHHSGPVSLAELLDTPGLRAGVSVSRSYGSAIDDLLSSRRGAENIEVSYGTGILEDQLRQLAAGRVDYVIGYPMEAAYISQNKLGGQRFRTIPILETQGDPVFTAVACTNNDWGREVIARIDRILKQSRPSPAYFQFFAPYVQPEDMNAFRDLYQRFLKTR